MNAREMLMNAMTGRIALAIPLDEALDNYRAEVRAEYDAEKAWHPFTAVILEGCREEGRICTQHCQEPCDDAIVAECPVVDALNGPLNDCIAELQPGSYLARISPDGDDVEIRPGA